MFKNYGLTIVLAGLFLVSWVLQAYFQYNEYIAEQVMACEPLDDTGFYAAFFSATFENWQSEFLQLFSFVLLSRYLIHKGSPQSKDGDDAMREQLNRIEKIVKDKF